MRILLAMAILAAVPAVASAQDRESRVSVGKNVRLDVKIGPNTATAKPAPVHSPPVIGVDPTIAASFTSEDGQFAGQLAKALDETRKVKVVSAARMGSIQADARPQSIDAMTRSEQADYVQERCKKFALDFLAAGNAQSSGLSVSPTTYIFGFGRTGTTSKSSLSLMDCKSREPVWIVTLNTKQSSGNVATLGGGGIAGVGGSGSSGAVAAAVVQTLLSDMGW